MTQDMSIEWHRKVVKFVSYSVQSESEQLKNNSDKAVKITPLMRFNMIVRAFSNSSILRYVEQPATNKHKGEVKPTDVIRIFNPINFMWEDMTDTLNSILAEVSPVPTTNNDTLKLARYIEAYLRASGDTVPQPYNGSRYLLFKNGVFDSKTKTLVPDLYAELDINYDSTHSMKMPIPSESGLEINGKLTSIFEVGFTPKHMHNVDLILDAKMPSYKGGQNHEWTPEGWLQRVAGNDAVQAEYIAQIMGVMLVPNHSFNMFIEINGAPHSGKTTLIEIVRSIYAGNYGFSEQVLFGKLISELDDNIPFRGNVNEDTALVHVTETNGAGITSGGISLINSFANQHMSIMQMGASSLTLTPPPILVMEGKGWAMFDSVKTGVARRLLPIDISNSETAEYTCAQYGKQVFNQKAVIEYLTARVVTAYAELTNGNDNFIFNIDNPKTLPEFAQIWHNDAVNAGDESVVEFIERMRHAMTRNGGGVSMKMLYEIYEASAKTDDENAFIRNFNSFKEIIFNKLGKFFKFEHLEHETRVTTDEQLAIDVEELEKRMAVPDSLRNYKRSNYSKYIRNDWYTVTIKDVEA